MNIQFVPYNLALRLKEIGFNEECLAHYFDFIKYPNSPRFALIYENYFTNDNEGSIAAPLWQQAFDWIREKYNLDSYVRRVTYREWKFEINYIIQNDSEEEWEKYKKFLDFKDTQEDAREACLEKLIEICKKN